METARKCVQVRGGPLGYIYARNRQELETDIASLLSAKSADSDAVVIPLLKGLTVEREFCTNVAAVSGARTTGLGGGGCGTTVKLLPTHYCPCAFAFYGSGGIAPSVAAGNLTAACESARERFGFSSYSGAPCPSPEETSGREICETLGLDPLETILYLVVTQSFREAVYLCNSFLYFGGVERVLVEPSPSRSDSCRSDGGEEAEETTDEGRSAAIRDGDGNDDDEPDGGRLHRRLDRGFALRIPLYPVHVATPDFNRVNGEPFNRKHRALGDNCEMPKAFFNDDLCRLLHGYVLGPAAVSLRIRNLDAVARGFAHTAFDETHEGVVLPHDVTFPLLDSERASSSPAAGDSGSSSSSAASANAIAGTAKRFGGVVGVNGAGGCGPPPAKKAATPAYLGESSSSDDHHHYGYGLERRTASVMASDATMAVESVISSSVYEDTIGTVDDWPMFDESYDEKERICALASYLTRVAGLVGSMVFASNSALYMNEVEDLGKPDGKETPQPSFYRFCQMAAPHVADSPLVDREGRLVRKPASASNGGSPSAGKGGGGSCGGNAGRRGGGGGGNNNGKYYSSSYHEYQLSYLAMACGFCAQLLAKMLFYIERCDAGASAFRYDSDALRHAASAIDSDVPCDMCSRFEKHRCARTTLYRLRHRLPKFGGAGGQIRGSLCLFGAATSNYSDTDPLGSYAPFSALKRAEGEASRTVIHDTYRVTAERLMAELDSMGLLNRDDPCDQTVADSFVRNAKSFVEAAAAVRAAAEREAAQLMHNLVYTREFKIREGLADANHTLYLAVEPYSSGICPLLSFLHRRSMLAVIQDMALSQCSHLMHGQQVEARNFRTQFQAVLRKRVMEMQNAGFLSSRPATVTLCDPEIVVPDPCKGQHAPPLTDSDGDLVRVNVEVIREFKIKNRVMFFGASAASSDAARARAAGMADAYQRPSRRVDVLSGPLGFALKRYHNVLFPNGKPGAGRGAVDGGVGGGGGGCSSSSSSAAAQWFWCTLQRNQMPARLLRKEDVDTIAFVKRFTDEYSDGNFVNVAPTCMAELAQFSLANAVLRFCDHKNYFITAITALTAQSKRPKDPSSVLPWIDGEVTSGSDLERRARELVDEKKARGGEACPKAWTSSFSATNMVRHVMSTKPLLVIGISVSKYQGISGSVRVFQAGNWGTVLGGKNVCSLMSFDKTRRYVMACPRTGFLVQKTGGYSTSAVKEKTIADAAKAIIAEGGSAPHAAIFSAALKAMGARVRDMDEDDWLAVTEDPYLATALCEINRAAENADGGWSVETAEAEAKKAADVADEGRAENGEATFDFGCCYDPSAVAATTPLMASSAMVAAGGGDVLLGGTDVVSGLFYDSVGGMPASSDSCSSSATSSSCVNAASGIGDRDQTVRRGRKRSHFSDPLFDMDPTTAAAGASSSVSTTTHQPPEKRMALTADMLL